MMMINKVPLYIQCGTPLHPLVDQQSITAGFIIITFIYHGGGLKSSWRFSLERRQITYQSRPSRFTLSEMKRYICKGGNTSNLMKHLQTRHSLNLKRCSVFDSLNNVAASDTASANSASSSKLTTSSSVQPDTICRTNAAASTSTREGNICFC